MVSSEEEEEEEEEEVEEPRRKKRRAGMSFVETEADVDEEEEEDEDEEWGEDDFVAVDERDEALALQPQIYRAVDGERDQQRRLADAEDVEALTQQLKDRYGRGAYRQQAFQGDASHVPMQFLLPTANDPALWLVRCKQGRELDIALALQRKLLALAASGHPLAVYAVIARHSLKGYLYVEARSMADVQAAIENTNNIYASKITMLPLEEMTQVLTIKPKHAPLRPGVWVRVKRGKYKGDLAQIVDVAENNASAWVKLIPRIDYSASHTRDKAKRKLHTRPPQRFFNVKDMPKRAESDLSRNQRGFWVWGADWFDKQGFLQKEIRTVGLDTENITPTLEEITKFNSPNQDDQGQIDLADVATHADETNGQQFVPGDLVTVTSGELINAQGTVVAIHQQHVSLRMRDAGLGEVMVEPWRLVKTFNIGDRVRVVRGKYKHEMGMITQVSDNTVTLFSDQSMEQLTVFLKDIKSAVDTLTTEQTKSLYALHDMVQLGLSNVGVIIKLEKDQYRIMDQNGTVRNVKPQEITQKRDSKHVTTVDAYSRAVSVGDSVEVLSGEHSGKRATVLHIFKTWVFLYTKDLVETSGVFVARSRMIASLAAKNAPMGAMGMGGGFPAQPRSQHFGGGRPGQSARRDQQQLLHKNVTIRGGPFKGYQGVVKGLTDKGARVELNTNGRIVNVPMEHVLSPEDMARGGSGAPMDRLSGSTASVYAGASMSDPRQNFQARAQGAATPMLGSKTPAYLGGMGASGGAGLGSKTPAWDAGSRTPAWDMGSKTPAYSSWGATRPTSPKRFGGTSSTGLGANANGSAGAGGFGEATAESLPWLLPGIEVVLVSGPHNGKTGYISSVSTSNTIGTIHLISSSSSSSSSSFQVPSQFLRPVRPGRKEKCIMLNGKLRGEKGTLETLEGDEGIMKDANGEWHDCRIEDLCKLHE